MLVLPLPDDPTITPTCQFKLFNRDGSSDAFLKLHIFEIICALDNFLAVVLPECQVCKISKEGIRYQASLTCNPELEASRKQSCAGLIGSLAVLAYYEHLISIRNHPQTFSSWDLLNLQGTAPKYTPASNCCSSLRIPRSIILKIFNFILFAIMLAAKFV